MLYFLGYIFHCILLYYKEQFKAIKRKRDIHKKFSAKKLLNYRFVNRALKFAGFSLLAGMICAVVLLPVYFILKSCSATSDNNPTTVQSYFTLFDFIETHFAALETTIRSSGDDVLPNVYTSVLTLILLPLYFANGKIRFKEKPFTAFLLRCFHLVQQ